MGAGLYRTSIGSKLFDAANYVFCLALALSCLYPFFYMFAISTSDYIEVAFGHVKLLPLGFHLESFKDVLNKTLILRSYANSIIYTVTSVLLVVALASMGGFVLADRRFIFKRSMTYYLLVMMFFSGGMIPTFLWVRALGLMDTMWAIVLPGAVGPFYIMLFRVYIKENVPDSLKESVYIDGGGDLVVYARIVLPLIKPILATIALFAAVGMWNSYISALIYLNDPRKFPLTLVLRKMVILGDFGGYLEHAMGREVPKVGDGVLSLELWTYGYMKSIKMAMTMVTVLPILLIYPFLQRYFVQGIRIGALKGE